MYSTAIRPIHQSKSLLETRRLHIGFACISACPEALEVDLCIYAPDPAAANVAGSQLLAARAQTRESATSTSRCLAHKSGLREVLGFRTGFGTMCKDLSVVGFELTTSWPKEYIQVRPSSGRDFVLLLLVLSAACDCD